MTQPTKNLRESVLERLEREGITPRSRYYWITYEYALWGTWALTVVLGAAALAILSFSSLYIGYSLYEATHGGFVTFFLDTLPYLWLIAFAGLTLIAYFNLRYTKRGYKYPLSLVIGSSFGFSVMGAVVLHFLGAGYYLDRYLGEHLWNYQSRVEFETQMWQNPRAGRLLGYVDAPKTATSSAKVAFVDAKNEHWSLIITELRPRDTALLMTGDTVRVLVATTSEDVRDEMVACAVFPWLMDDVPVIAKWREDRRLFLEEVAERRAKLRGLVDELKEAVEAGKAAEPSRPATTTAPEQVVAEASSSPCANHPIFRGRP